MMATFEEVEVGLGLASAEVVAFLRSEPDVHLLTTGGEWTVRDTAVHLICVTRMYTTMLNGQLSPFRTSSELSAWNAGTFLAMEEDQPTVLACLVDKAVASFLDVGRRRQRDDPIEYATFTTTAGVLTGFQCYEHLLHGFDMARSVGYE